MTLPLAVRRGPGLTVDVALFTLRSGRVHVLVVKRAKEPHRGAVALPGGFVEQGERLVDAAARELVEETGIVVAASDLERVGVYGEPGRDPRGRVISVVYTGHVAGVVEPRAGSDAKAAEWVSVEEVEHVGVAVAFDHGVIIRDAVAVFRDHLQYAAVALDFCPPRFTLDDVRSVYEIVWGVAMDAGSFARSVLRVTGFVEPEGVGYRRGVRSVLTPPIVRP